MIEITTPVRRGLPRPRGPLSAELVDVLSAAGVAASGLPNLARRAVHGATMILADDDAQLTLTLLYELHYRGWHGVDDGWEWDPALVATAAVIERRMTEDLQHLVRQRYGPLDVQPGEVAAALLDIVAVEVGPNLSSYLARQATEEQFAEFLVHRSIYHLKEADPHTWAIPRLAGAPKAALVEVQTDEYGGGRTEWMHSTLFGDAMRGLGLDDTYGAYLDSVPAVTLAWVNTMSLFGLHRRHRGAVAGHLAALEMTSSVPNRRYGNGLRRLGFGPETTRFFDEHVEADAVHEQIACHDLAGRLATDEPELASDVAFGAAAALATDALVGEHLLASWEAGRASLALARGTLAR